MKTLSPTQEKTRKNLLEAAIELMSERGFHRVSMQEIGEKAGLCEKTVFRYFPTKTDILTGIIRHKAYIGALKEEFEKKRTWHLDHDLPLVARLYLQATKAKKKVFRAYLSALESVDTNGEDFQRDPRALLVFVSEYIREMQRKGRVREGDAELMARAFINTLHGYMLTYLLNDDEAVWRAKADPVRFTIGLFIRGFSPEPHEDKHN